MKHVFSLLLGLVVFCASAQTTDIFQLNKNLGRGINFGNALEAPVEGAWSMVLEAEYFSLVNEVGFDTVRLPVSWTYHTDQSAPYTIDAAFMARVQWAVDEALKHDLNIIVNVHHYDALNADPLAEEARYQAIWRQIAEHFQAYPRQVYFELLNEPHNVFNQNHELWNALLESTLAVVRQSNPERAVIIGPINWNNTNGLGRLELPDDPNLIVTVHFYEPFGFTHQGAEWVANSPPVGTGWSKGTQHLSYRWQDQSDGASLTFLQDDTGNVVQLGFADADASAHLQAVISPRGYDTLALTTLVDETLRLSCNADTRQTVTVMTEALSEALVPLEACGADRVLKDLFIQNAEADTVDLVQLELRGDGKPPLSPFADDATELRETLNEAQSWAFENNRPLLLGEFGAYSKADMASRVRWTSFVRKEIEKRNMSWAYWEFGAGFGVYDREAESWQEGLLEALLGP